MCTFAACYCTCANGGCDREVFLVEYVSEGCGELKFAEKEARTVQKWAMNSVCLLYEVALHGLLETLKQSSENIFEGVQAIICNL